MNLMKKLIIKYNELIVYVFFGVCTTGVNFVTFKLFNMLLGDERYLVSNIFAWFFSVLFAYVTNKIWVFDSKNGDAKAVLKEFLSFFSSRVFTLLVEELFLFLLVDCLKFSQKSLELLSFTIGGEMIAKIIVSVIVVVLNYVFSKFLVFKKK